jgi:hypothetical protein
MKFVSIVATFLFASVCFKTVKGDFWDTIWGGIKSVVKITPIYHAINAVDAIVQGNDVGSAILNGINDYGNAVGNAITNIVPPVHVQFKQEEEQEVTAAVAAAAGGGTPVPMTTIPATEDSNIDDVNPYVAVASILLTMMMLVSLYSWIRSVTKMRLNSTTGYTPIVDQVV